MKLEKQIMIGHELIGEAIEQLDTPCLMIDKALLKKNGTVQKISHILSSGGGRGFFQCSVAELEKSSRPLF